MLLKNKKCLLLFLASILLINQIVSAVNRPTIYKWDLRFAYSWSRELQYDTFHMAVGLQGLANREAPRVFLVFDDADQLWLERLVEAGGLCEGWNVQTINNISEYINTFSKYANGVVLYDDSPETGVISTSLVATSSAAAEGCLALRNAPTSGIYRMLITNSTSPKLPITINLSGKFNGSGTIWGTSVASTGSAKCDAYLWLIENYIKTGLLDTTKIVHTMDLWGMKEEVAIDHAQLRNLDYAFSRKTVCFELSPWSDEVPNDDPTQPLGTDFYTFKKILDECNRNNNYSEMIKFCGFNNWAYKYTDHGDIGGLHGGVATEWETVRLITAYNSYMEGDALGLSYVSNTSFYDSLEPALKSKRYVQNSPPSYQDMVDKGYIDAGGNVVANNYVMIYMGDYDQASWMLYWLGGDRYDDPARGQIPCSWALTPNSIDRVSVAFDYMYRNKSERDVFFAGDSGAGYVQPKQLYGERWPSGYGDGREIWKKHCEKYYRMLDYSISGWILNGASGTLDLTDADIYKQFSGDGIGFNSDLASPTLRDNIPVTKRNGPDLYNENISASALGLTSGSGVNFAWYRSILLYPQKLKALEDECAVLGNDYKFVDAYTFYYLMRYYMGGNNDYRASWVGDDIPYILETSKTHPVDITVRNDGWDSWSAGLNYRLAYAIVPRGTEPTNTDFDIRGRFDIPSGLVINTGQVVTFDVDVVAPTASGEYDLYYDMVRDGVTWFVGRNNLEWKMPITVVDNKYSVDSDGDGIADVIELENGLLPWYPKDGGCGDIGFIDADITGSAGIPDCYVNIYDIALMSEQWLNDSAQADILGDTDFVDILDYSLMAKRWLSCNDPANIECW